MNDRPSWDEWGLALAATVATRASCTRSQVGAVLMGAKDHRIYGVGYNGTSAGEVNCGDGGCPRGLLSYDECPPLGSYANCKALHAEVNCIDNSIDYGYDQIAFGDLTLYVTRPCCEGCLEYIRMYPEITRVVTPDVHH